MNNELFGERHEQEEYSLYGNLHKTMNNPKTSMENPMTGDSKTLLDEFAQTALPYFLQYDGYKIEGSESNVKMHSLVIAEKAYDFAKIALEVRNRKINELYYE